MVRTLPSLLLSLLCLCSATSACAEWKLIDFTDEAAFYIDDFFETGQKARVWELIDYRQPTQFGSHSAKILWEVDCAGSRVRTLSFTSHPHRMGIGEPISMDNTPGEWALPPEYTPQESVFILACGFEPSAGPKT
jgi:hypothetical protein